MITKLSVLTALTFVVATGSAYFYASVSYAQSSVSTNATQSDNDIADQFFSLLLSADPIQINKTLKNIEQDWSIEHMPMAIETLGFAQSEYVRSRLFKLIDQNSPKKAFKDNNARYQWLWNQDIPTIKGYANFKAQLYSHIDQRFETYFKGRQELASIRLDEIRWGGVIQDGIPPLRNPDMIGAEQADYLGDNNIVFGIEINGDARAYPKRILAWHEMFTDTIGGVDIAGVYCTLCGAVIPYRTEHKGTKYQLGTSGFLYRSNKLMYDQATQSLWSTLEGKPVVGPLVGKGIQMDYLSVVTTTWGEWKKRHPDTQVLSLKTGHQRDYGEGVAYQEYFSDDELMFNVPSVDKKLKNKQSILAIRLPENSDQPLAISVKYLKKNPIYQSTIGDTQFVVFTDKTGANRVYDATNLNFSEYDQQFTATDKKGGSWTVYEDRIENKSGEIRPRIHTFNAFWFGWQAAYPNTKLVK